MAFFSAVCFIQDAHAVFTFSPYTPVRQITMRVGAAGATVNTVTFNVAGANVAPTPTAVIGVPDAATPATTPVGGTEVTLTAGLRSPGGQRVTLNVNSSAAMNCVAGSGCGTTAIPMNTVSWISYNHTNFPTFDIQNGTFTGATNQQLTNYIVNGSSVTMSNVLIFQYNNATLYPAGQYRGRVVYTAAIP